MKFNGLGNLCASVLSKFHALFAKARRKILKFAGKDAALNLIAYLQIAKPYAVNLDLAVCNGSNKLKDRRRREREIQSLRADFTGALQSRVCSLACQTLTRQSFHIDFALARL